MTYQLLNEIKNCERSINDSIKTQNQRRINFKEFIKTKMKSYDQKTINQNLLQDIHLAKTEDVNLIHHVKKLNLHIDSMITDKNNSNCQEISSSPKYTNYLKHSKNEYLSDLKSIPNNNVKFVNFGNTYMSPSNQSTEKNNDIDKKIELKINQLDNIQKKETEEKLKKNKHSKDQLAIKHRKNTKERNEIIRKIESRGENRNLDISKVIHKGFKSFKNNNTHKIHLEMNKSQITENTDNDNYNLNSTIHSTPMAVRPYFKPDNLQVQILSDIDIKETDLINEKDGIQDSNDINRASMSKTTLESQHGMSDRSLFSSKVSVSSPRFVFNHTPKQQQPKRKKSNFNSIKLNQIELNQTLNDNLENYLKCRPKTVNIGNTNNNRFKKQTNRTFISRVKNLGEKNILSVRISTKMSSSFGGFKSSNSSSKKILTSLGNFMNEQ